MLLSLSGIKHNHDGATNTEVRMCFVQLFLLLMALLSMMMTTTKVCVDNALILHDNDE